MSTTRHDAFAVLEFDKIRERVLEETFSIPGRENLIALPFFTESESLCRELASVTEMRDCLKYDDAFPLTAFSDIRPDIKNAETIGAFLRADAFLSIRRFLFLIRQIHTFFDSRPEKYPLLQEISGRLYPLPDLEREIDHVVDDSGDILDRASGQLYRIRQDIRRKESDVRKKLEAVLREMVSHGFAQEDVLVLRDGRLVVPMKDASCHRLKGVVVDQSASGATVFMEPLEAVDINNGIRQLRIREKVEEEDILRQLTVRIRENEEALRKNIDGAAQLDALSARARFSLKIHGHAGSIAEDRVLELKSAKHPLLLLILGEKKVVPLNLRLGDGLKTVVVTGPNAGGKTVVLKTIGLLALMHQHGLHIPAQEGTCLPLFSGIFADIGDRQSIEQDLSTFSSHIRTIKSILDLSDQNSLVLLDEIGSATDPEEGAALAQSTLRTLARRGCLTLATTHMGALKLYAHGTDGVENASLTFDNKTLQPTYRFQMGIPGASYAFEIAQRFGLPENLVSEARTLVGHERGRMDHLLMDLERESRRVHETLSNVEIEQSRLAGLIALYQDKIAKAKEEGEKIKQTRLEEAESILQKTNRLAENLIRELRETKGDPSKIREHRSLLAEHRKLIQLHRGKPNEKGEAIFHPGDWILWDGHGGKARVLSEADGKGRLWVQWNDVRLQVSGSECRLLEKSETSVSPRTHVECDSGGSVRDEVDLRGMTVDESLPVLEKYLSDASMAGLSLVRIIHGKGTGVLRKEVGNYLKRHALVKSQRLGHWNEGDTGVTIVELL